LSVAEKRTWLRRRALECYRKAGQLDGAIAQYRAAIKTNPDDFDLRLELADALLANDQVIAGRNELRRILARDPGHQEARAKLAEFHQTRGETWEAERLWREAVDADPDFEPAKRGLAELLRQRGHGEFQAGYHARARDTYAAALKLTPTDVDLLASIGYAELLLNNETAARAYFEDALAQGTPDAYTHVFDRWTWKGNPNEARQIVARAEAAPVAMPHFYVNAAGTAFRAAQPPALDPFAVGPKKKTPSADSWEDLGQTLVAKAMSAAADRADVYQHIVGEVGLVRPELALPAAEKLVTLSPDDPAVLVGLALMQGMTDRRREARDTLRKAAQLARKRNDSQLIAEIENMRRALDDPLFGTLSRLLPMMGDLDFEDMF
jgi:tetratricopeptide (TPR) repeat protein